MSDVVVVGAGPAGMSAAAELSGRGLDAVVVERLASNYGRYHSICGEAVSARTFSRLGWGPEGVVREVDAISISFPGGVSVRIPVEGYVIDRPAMLAGLRDRCDCRFVTGTVSRVEAGDVCTVTLGDGTVLRSRYVIGADGAHSAVRRDVFGRGPARSLQVYNCIVRGEGSELAFRVGDFPDGFYGWRFPSAPGTVSVGFPRGHTDPRSIDGIVSYGARTIPFGVPEDVVRGNVLLCGDAACLANPLCFGGIGAALLSGRNAARAVLDSDPGRYQRWVSRDRMFDRHFLEAHDTYASWGPDEIVDAMEPFRGGYSLWRGLRAMIRRPRWANVYMATFVAFRLGWRRRTPGTVLPVSRSVFKGIRGGGIAIMTDSVF